MSYNESLRADSNYPHMSQSEWDNAPWNQDEQKERTYPITIDQCLRKSGVEVNTKNYIEYDFDEDLSNVDWKSEYNEQHYTIPEMLAQLKEYIEADIRTLQKTRTRAQRCKRTRLKTMLQDCQGWELMDETYEKE